MLTDIYVEALLADEKLADQVWEAWDGGFLSDQVALSYWILFASGGVAMRAYHFTSTGHALDDLRNSRLKIATIDDLNDPFELLGVDLRGKEDRSAFRAWRDEMAKGMGMLCFSRNWHSPLLWAHYGDRHKGICLGFDLADESVGNVIYTSTRIRLNRYDLERNEISLQKMLQVLSSKFTDWAYEDEVRAFSNLRDSDADTGLYFADFSSSVVLREIIAGPLCTTTENQIREIVPDTSVKLIKARLAFRSYRVVKNKQGFRSAG